MPLSTSACLNGGSLLRVLPLLGSLSRSTALRTDGKDELDATSATLFLNDKPKLGELVINEDLSTSQTEPWSASFTTSADAWSLKGGDWPC